MLGYVKSLPNSTTPEADKEYVPPVSMMAIVGLNAQTQAPTVAPPTDPYRANDNVVMTPFSGFPGGPSVSACLLDPRLSQVRLLVDAVILCPAATAAFYAAPIPAGNHRGLVGGRLPRPVPRNLRARQDPRRSSRHRSWTRQPTYLAWPRCDGGRRLDHRRATSGWDSHCGCGCLPRVDPNRGGSCSPRSVSTCARWATPTLIVGAWDYR